MIVTIDGPAGAGKSTAARALAAKLGFRFLDTGAMYRAVALAAVRRGLDWADSAAIARAAREVKIELDGDRVLLDGEDVSQAIRTPEITSATRYAADNPGVREHLVELQREAAGDDDVVSEGRDQGTVVFPRAECKIFLTASPEARARRRMIDLAARGADVNFDDVLEAQNERDHRDASRPIGPLVRAADAVEVCTDGLEAGEVVARLEALVCERAGRR